ncbi:hypothetical protein BB559_004213 [Furculomyces boomerangus]|uniref:RRM domain-containing protein n=2 Tax=Harpellales TaxID=61421 RepID=A0A2T9YFZ9_9FUNG|nr:hypothetical protein BB559_004213 [Furculomyces boomerangus]PVZ98853.1 hypothetical protein BB558_005137 [Smittium angustum]
MSESFEHNENKNVLDAFSAENQDYGYTTVNNEFELGKDDINVHHTEVPESWGYLRSENETGEIDYSKNENDQTNNYKNSENPKGSSTQSVPQKYIGKLFVGGLSWETTEESLKEYFSAYGEVVDTSIMRDQTTGRPRGFGFVTFSEHSTIEKVLQEPSHIVDNKKIDPKPAVPRDQQGYQPSGSGNDGNFSRVGEKPHMSGGVYANQSVGTGEQKPDTLFAGGLPPGTSDDDLRRAFEKFGNIIEVKMMIDRETGRPRGFAFVQFESEAAASRAISECESGGGMFIKDKRVDVKHAVHRKKGMQGNYSSGMGSINAGGYPNQYISTGNMMGMGYGMDAAGMMGYASGMGMNPSNMVGGYGYGMMNPNMMSAYGYMMNPAMMGSVDYQSVQNGYAIPGQSNVNIPNPMNMQMYGYGNYDGSVGNQNEQYADGSNNMNGPDINGGNSINGGPRDQEYSSGNQNTGDSWGNSMNNSNTTGGKSRGVNSGYEGSNQNYKGRGTNNDAGDDKQKDRRDRRDRSRDNTKRDRSGDRDRTGRSYSRQQPGSRSYGYAHYSK